MYGNIYNFIDGNIYNFSKKLDETTAELKRTSLALEKEKAKTDMLLYQMLPVRVADQLREGRKVDAGKQAPFKHSISALLSYY